MSNPVADEKPTCTKILVTNHGKPESGHSRMADPLPAISSSPGRAFLGRNKTSIARQTEDERRNPSLTGRVRHP